MYSQLKGVRVLDLGSALAGPYATSLMAMLGAEVVKIEKPRRGDLIRFTDKHVGGSSGYFLGINPGKSSITLDLRVEAGQDVLRRLVPHYDVLVENFRPGRMDEWGIGYDNLKTFNDKLIYCSVTAFGDAKGFPGETGNDAIAQAYSGIMDLTGEANGPPDKTGPPVVDVAGAFLAGFGILAALYKRKETGAGCRIDVSLMEAAYALMPNFMMSVLNGEPSFSRWGSGHPQLVPYQAFVSKNGEYLVVGAFHRKSWRALCEVIGREELLSDPRFTENWDRLEHRDELIPILEEALKQRERNEWLELFRKSDVPIAPVLSLSDSVNFFSDEIPGFIRKSHHSELGELKTTRPPFKFSSDGEIEDMNSEFRTAPVLGEDTQRVLSEIGLTKDEVSALQAAGIV